MVGASGVANSIPPGVRIVRQNPRTIEADIRSPALAWNVHCRFVQVAAQAWNRESVPSPLGQHRLEVCADRFTMEFAQSALLALQCIADASDRSLILILSDINMPGMGTA
jgi:CheY-like chemotaxis protein